MNIRPIAFYLPQFHPIPENDLWWGKGFTEWTNVSKARPLFKGHYQPHLPADLGFYDLRLPEARQAQADLAREYAIEGFCYWHYWFNGKRLLERPFNEVLQSGKPDFPFCLAWANEPWSRRWLGESRDILCKQEHSPEDDRNHIRWLINAFRDERYIRVDGRPLFLIYRPKHLPNPERTTDLFRAEVRAAGLPEPYLVGVNAHCFQFDCRPLGFDANLNFQPQLGVLPEVMKDSASESRRLRNLTLGIDDASLKLYDYRLAHQTMTKHRYAFPAHPCVFVGWDNTPRRGEKGIVIAHQSPEIFERRLRIARDAALADTSDRPLVFINAWNEWAEGNHLEPDMRSGHAYLEAVKRVATED